MDGVKSNESLQTLSMKAKPKMPGWKMKDRLGNIGAKKIAEMLKINKNIHEIDLSNNNISDDGVGYIIEALSKNKNTSLKKLNLDSNIISPAGLKALDDFMKKSGKMEKLDFMVWQRGNALGQHQKTLCFYS